MKILSTVVVPCSVLPKYACGQIASSQDLAELKDSRVSLPDVVLQTDYSRTNWIYSTLQVESAKYSKEMDMIFITPLNAQTRSNLYFIAVAARAPTMVKMTAASNSPTPIK